MTKSLIYQQIREEADPQRAVRLLTDAVERNMQENDRCHEVLDDKMEKIEKVLWGNGDPTHSLTARLEKLENAWKSITGIGMAILLTVLTQLVLAVIKIYGN